MPSNEPERERERGSNSKCRKAITIPLFVLNLITWICGGGLIGLGIWLVSTDNQYEHFAENRSVYIVYMCLSAALFTAGIFGACGVLASNKVLLKLYFVLICLVFGGLLGMVIFTAVQRNVVEDLIVDHWDKTSDDTREFFQNKFDCCGINDDITLHPKSNLDDSCFVNATAKERKQNCLSKLKEWFEDNQTTIAIIGSSIMVIMLMLMIASCWLIQSIKKAGRRNRVVPIEIDYNTGTHGEMVVVEEPEESYSGGKQNAKTSGKAWAKQKTRH